MFCVNGLFQFRHLHIDCERAAQHAVGLNGEADATTPTSSRAPLAHLTFSVYIQTQTWARECSKRLWACSSCRTRLSSLDGRSAEHMIFSNVECLQCIMGYNTDRGGWFTAGRPTSIMALLQWLMLSVWRNWSPVTWRRDIGSCLTSTTDLCTDDYGVIIYPPAG